MKKTPIVIWKNVTLPTTGTLASRILRLDQVYSFAVQAVWTGSPNGTFTLLGSCDAGAVDQYGNVTGVANWTTIATTSVAAGGAPGNLMYNEVGAAFLWTQLLYTSSTVGGTVSAMLNIVGLG